MFEASPGVFRLAAAREEGPPTAMHPGKTAVREFGHVCDDLKFLRVSVVNRRIRPPAMR